MKNFKRINHFFRLMEFIYLKKNIIIMNKKQNNPKNVLFVLIKYKEATSFKL